MKNESRIGEYEVVPEDTVIIRLPVTIVGSIPALESQTGGSV